MIHSRLFGGDGIRQVGFRLGWLTELPWYSEFHFGAQNADGPNMVSFLGSRHEHGAHGEHEHDEEAIGGRPVVIRDVSRLDDLVWLARWYNAWDPTDEISTALGLSIRVSEMLYTFGCLVLPPLAARSLAREMRGMLLLSPILALVASALGFVLANACDYPPAQTTVGLLCLALALAWLYRRGRRIWSPA